MSILEFVPWICLAVVLVLFAMFLFIFPKRFSDISKQLVGATKHLNTFPHTATVNPHDLDEGFSEDPLKHIWKEFLETLHAMRITEGSEQSSIIYRSTLPAEMMFTRESLAEDPLFDDFFRHLPGILTGLGIIGTFAGLISGLQKFSIDPSKPAEVMLGLKPLLDSVMHAFITSGTAIFFAMVVVGVGRLLVANLYKKIKELCKAIDVLYESGAGEEYLQRLVESSEKSEVHAAQLKDGLFEDLKSLMTNLTERQITSQNQVGQFIGKQVSESIVKAIGEPMKRFGDAMENTTKGNGEQINGMLETLLTGFMAKLEDTFGGQINGINQQIKHSMEAMTAVQTSFQALVQDIQRANENATDHMGVKLEEAMKAATENQQMLISQMAEFVQNFKALTADEQQKNKEVMNEATASVLGELQKAMSDMEHVRRAASEEEQLRINTLTDKTGAIVTNLSDNVEDLLKLLAKQVVAMRETIETIQENSSNAIEGMKAGALKMNEAAKKFETAGEVVVHAFDKSSKFIEEIKASSASLQIASTAVNNGFEKYDMTRKTVDSQVIALTGLIESAKREAGVSKQLISAMEDSAKVLKLAEENTRQHLSNVSEELVNAFKVFGTSLVEKIREAIGETDKHLSQGTGHLRAIIQELEIAINKMLKIKR